MTDKFPKELLSAWYDEETSSAEGAQAERQLESSAETRSELDDFGKLSTLMKSLPTESAPEGFRAAVMQAVERETLLAAPVSETASASPIRRAWWQGVAAIAVSALVVVMMVEFLKTPTGVPANTTVAQGDLDRPRAESTERDFAPRPTTVAAAPPMEGGFGNEASRVRSSADSPAEDADGQSSARLRVAESSPALSKPTVESADLPAFDAVRAGRSQLVFNDNLKRADVGQIVEALETIDGEVAVVRLTVVDRRGGLDALQLLLSRDKIPQEKAEAGSRRELDRNPKNDAAEPLVAVFVEASSEQLAQALLQLNEQGSIQSLEVEEPIAAGELAMVDGIVPAFKRVAAAADSAAESDKKNKRGAPLSKHQDKKVASGVGVKADAAKPQSPGGFGAAKEAGPAANRGERFARQQQVALPPEVLKRRANYRMRSKLQQSAPVGSAGSTQPKDAAVADAAFADNAAIRRKTTVRRSLQVLFVLIPSAAAQPAAAPAEKKSGDENPNGAA